MQIAKDCEQSANLHMLCPTRWTVRTRSISAVISSYKAIHDTLSATAGDTKGRSGIKRMDS